MLQPIIYYSWLNSTNIRKYLTALEAAFNILIVYLESHVHRPVTLRKQLSERHFYWRIYISLR